MNSDGTDNSANNSQEFIAVPQKTSSDGSDNPEVISNTDLLPDDLDTSKTPEEQSIPLKEKLSEPAADESIRITETAVSKNQKKFSLFNAIQVILGIIIGAGAGYLILYLLIPEFFTPAELIVILIFIIISFFINLNLYKLGQLIAGRINGGQVISYQFTCLRFFRNDGIMRRRFTPYHSFEGQCSVIPPSNKPYRSSKYIAFYTGGVAACAVAGCICILTAILLSASTSGSQFAGNRLAGGHAAFFTMFLWVNAVFSLMYVAVCLLPVFWGDSPSDGTILYALLTKSPYTASLIILRTITLQLAAGIRPSNIHIPEILPVRIIKKRTGQKTVLSAAFGNILSRLYICTGKLKSHLTEKLHSAFTKPSRNINESVVDQAINNISDAINAAEISDLPQTDEPEDNFDYISANVPEKTGVELHPKKSGINIGVLFYKIKLWLCPEKISKDDLEIEPFPRPAETENNLSAYTLLLKLYDYYIALDNAEQTDMRTHLMTIEENIKRVPRQMIQRACRELCFYYSIGKNPASAARYMEIMERNPEQKKQIDDLRVRAYFEMYINRRYKTAFSICRNAMETAAAGTGNGLTVMNRELVKGLVILIHQKTH